MSDIPRFTLLANRGLLAIAGPDRVSFLQGLVSNDMEKVALDRVVYAALLNPQGKFLYDFFVFGTLETLILDCELDCLEGLKKRLSLYKMRADVTLEDRTGEMTVSALIGDEELVEQELPREPGAAIAFGGGIVCRDPRLADIGWRFLLPYTETETILVAAGFSPTHASYYDRMRLCLGLPDGKRDLISEKSILLESGFSELNGVDWNKGCFIGQELTARTKYRGLIKKRLVPVSYNGPPPEPGTLILAGDKGAGEIRSSLATKDGGIGLALIRLEALASPFDLMADGVLVTPSRPHWMLDEL
jgi:folate-binding protein YgfZ